MPGLEPQSAALFAAAWESCLRSVSPVGVYSSPDGQVVHTAIEYCEINLAELGVQNFEALWLNEDFVTWYRDAVGTT